MALPSIQPAAFDPSTSIRDADQLRDAAGLVIYQQACWRVNLMRTLMVSAAYAEALLEHLEAHGVIGPPAPSGAPSRAVLVRAEQRDEALARLPRPAEARS